MAVYSSETKRFLCECGCGQEINFWASYAQGHYFKTKEGSDRLSTALSGYVKEELHQQHITESLLFIHRLDPTIGEEISESNHGGVLTDKQVENLRRVSREYHSSEE